MAVRTFSFGRADLARSILLTSLMTLSVVPASRVQGAPGKVQPEGDGRTVIRSLPYTITAPGSYALGGALSTAGDGITIAASDVTLDLCGFTVSGTGSGAGRGIVVRDQLANVCVRNGAVARCGSDGFYAPGDTAVTLEDFRASRCAGNGVVVGGGELRRVTAESNGRSGVAGAAAGGAAVIMTDCVAEGNRECGIVHRRPGKAKYKNIVLRTNGQHGLYLDSEKVPLRCDLELDEVSASENGGSGLRCAPASPGFQLRCRLERCRCVGNTVHGFSFESGAAGFFEAWPCRSAFSGNGGQGLHVAMGGESSVLGFTAADCQFLNNGGPGAVISSNARGSRSNARCSGSEFNDNGGTGLAIDTRVRTVGPITDCIAAVAGCCFAGNKGHGVLLAHEAAHVVQSRASGNALDGVRIEDCDDADVENVAALRNGGAGFRIRCTDGACRNLTASNNGGGGVDQDCDGTALLDGVRSTSNGGHGIRFRCPGPVTMDRCEAASNKLAGVSGDCDDLDASLCQAVGNGTDGFDLSSSGTIRLRSSSALRNPGSGVRCVCSSGWAEENNLAGNGKLGLELVAADGASVTGNVITKNGGGGLRYVGSYGDVSNNRCSGNSGDAVEVDGEHNRIASNVVTNNGRGFALRSGVNPLYENTQGVNKNPLYEDVPNDLAPTSPASKATSPFSNIEAP